MEQAMAPSNEEQGVDSRSPRSTLAGVWHAIVRLPYKPADHPYGYLVAVSGMIMQMINYGIADNFQIYTKFMSSDATLGYPSATSLSYNNSVSLGLSPIFGLFVGWIADRVDPRITAFASTLLIFLGLWICATYANGPLFIIFTYSLFTSIASALMLSPGAASTGSWFLRRRAVGMGINFCGGAFGNLIFPTTLNKWVVQYGWRKTMRMASSFCSLGLLATLLTCRRINRTTSSVSLCDGADEQHRHQSQNQRQQQQQQRKSDSVERDAVCSSSNTGSDRFSKVNKLGASAYEAPTAIYVSPVSADGGNSYTSDGNGAGNHLSNMGSKDTEPSVTHAMHTRLITFHEVLRVFLTLDFLTHFALFFIYAWGFYAFYYVYVRLIQAFGTPSTVYEHLPALSTSEMSKIFVTYGVFEILGSVLAGCIAALTTNALTMVLCCTVSGMAMACLAMCQTYTSLTICLVFVAFFKAGIFAVLPALISDSLYGPNLTFLMNCVFVSGSIGGFAAPPVHAQIVHHTNGNYSYSCIFMSVCLTIPGYICFFCLWKNKQSCVARLCQRLLSRPRSTAAVGDVAAQERVHT